MGWGQTLTERWFLWVEGLGSQGRSWRTWDLSQTSGGWVGGVHECQACGRPPFCGFCKLSSADPSQAGRFLEEYSGDGQAQGLEGRPHPIHSRCGRSTRA